jgi:hypothetical protein
MKDFWVRYIYEALSLTYAHAIIWNSVMNSL